MRIPMVDLVAQYRDLQPKLEPAFLSALSAAQFILGPNVQAFEMEAADYLGVQHAITCANGVPSLFMLSVPQSTTATLSGNSPVSD